MELPLPMALTLVPRDKLPGREREDTEILQIIAPIAPFAVSSVQRSFPGVFGCEHTLPGYPPDKQEKATQTVLEQAELIATDWAV